MAYKSVIDGLEGRADEIKILIQKLGKLSDITDLVEQQRQNEMWGRPSGLHIVYAEPYSWDELPPEGKQVQQELHEAYNPFREIVQTLIKPRIGEVQQRYSETDKCLAGYIEHNRASSGSVVKDVQSHLQHVDDLIALVAEGNDTSDRRTVFVPDTNALLHNPKIEDWSFPDANKFRLILTPTVLGELDRLKIEHRNEAVRNKAESFIRQIKEYRRRGRLEKGVTIRAGICELVGLAVEPVMSATLSWLDKDHADDRLIASTIEVMRSYLHSPVVLVTRDLNVQNKASFAGIEFIEPPEPQS